MSQNTITPEDLLFLRYGLLTEVMTELDIPEHCHLDDDFAVRVCFESWDILRLVFTLAVKIGDTKHGSIIYESPSKSRINKVVFWKCLELILRRCYNRYERKNFLAMTGEYQASDKLVVIDNPGGSYYDLSICHKLIQSVSSGLTLPDGKVVVKSIYKVDFWQPGTTISIDQMSQHIAVLVPFAEFSRVYWYQQLGPTKNVELGLHDLLKVLDAIAASGHPKMKRLWYGAMHDDIVQLREIAKLPLLPPAT